MSAFEAAKAADRIIKAIRAAMSIYEIEKIMNDEEKYIKGLEARYECYHKMIHAERDERTFYLMQKPLEDL